MSRELPAKPNLEHLKKQAKELLRDFHSGDSSAAERFQSFGLIGTPQTAKLSDAQYVIAHDYGFASWPKLKEHVDSFTLTPMAQFVAAVCAQNAQREEQLLKNHPELKAHLDEPFHYGDLPVLLAAVQRNDRESIDALLSAGANINTRGKSWAGEVCWMNAIPTSLNF